MSKRWGEVVLALAKAVDNDHKQAKVADVLLAANNVRGGGSGQCTWPSVSPWIARSKFLPLARTLGT